MYDTYCYSRRYERVPYKKEERFTEWKLDDPILAPYGKAPKFTDAINQETLGEKENTDVETSVEPGESNGL